MKPMNTALEQSRPDEKAVKNEFASLQVRCKVCKTFRIDYEERAWSRPRGACET